MRREHLETAAVKYSYLRGLLAVPAGALFILAALGNWEVGPLRNAWAFLVVLALAGVAYLLIARRYEEQYGRVTLSTGEQVRSGIALVVAIAVMIGGSLLLRSRAGFSLDLPVNAVAVSFAVVMLVTTAIARILEPHHALVWGALLVAGAVPVWTGGDPSNVGLVMAGVAVIVNGVLDHRALVRTFGPSTARLQDGDASA
jgi:hypothetical protein